MALARERPANPVNREEVIAQQEEARRNAEEQQRELLGGKDPARYGKDGKDGSDTNRNRRGLTGDPSDNRTTPLPMPNSPPTPMDESRTPGDGPATTADERTERERLEAERRRTGGVPVSDRPYERAP